MSEARMIQRRRSKKATGRIVGSRRWAVLGATAGVLLVAACSSVQTTRPGTVGVDRSQRMSSLVSEAELRQGAVQAYKEVLGKEQAGGTLNPDPAMTNRVRGIARRIIAQTGVFRPDAAGWAGEVNVIRSDQINARCRPCGTNIRP